MMAKIAKKAAITQAEAKDKVQPVETATKAIVAVAIRTIVRKAAKVRAIRAKAVKMTMKVSKTRARAMWTNPLVFQTA
jgi:hypothetical protein